MIRRMLLSRDVPARKQIHRRHADSTPHADTMQAGSYFEPLAELDEIYVINSNVNHFLSFSFEPTATNNGH